MRLNIAARLIFLVAALAMPVAGHAQIGIGVSITIAPPELPVYVQPEIPAPGYIWAPGYWAYGPDGYFWVPGTWVQPPAVGLLWTPGYWGWRDGVYVWNEGYWGPHVGFYGGVNYGFGYVGTGYLGGRWVGGVFSYNQSVNNFGSVHITNVYNETVINNNVTRVSFNGGNGGTSAQPTAAERAASQEHHVAPTALQTQHQQMASTNKALLASQNHGQPTIAATSKPGEFSGRGVVAAKEVGPGNGNKPNTGPAGTKLNGPTETKLSNPANPEGSKSNAPGKPGGNPQGSAALEKQELEKQQLEKQQLEKREQERKGPGPQGGQAQGGNAGAKPLATTTAGPRPPAPPQPHPQQPQQKGKEEKKPPG
ncbi:MAG TPA: YXWGXW repeat-containing protein [Xanthobacteraceae bacterium]|nr:YXWGXW repeat-containing protein [Xanthobacteraceae bacterium]